MTVTSSDVARAAGVSRATVSYILNGKDGQFTEKTRELVKKTAQDLGYRPVAAAQTLARGSSNVILMLIPLSPNAEFMSLMSQLAQELSKNSQTLLMMPPIISPKDLEYTVQTVRPRLFLAENHLTEEQKQVLKDAETPFVDIAEETSHPGGMNWRIGQLQAEHLIARGRKSLVYARLSTAEDDAMQRARRDGFLSVCERHSLARPTIVTVSPQPNADIDIVRSLPQGCGIACYNDDTAAAILGAGHLTGLTAPGDFAIIGVDNTTTALQTNPQLSTVAITWDLAPFLQALQARASEGTPLNMRGSRGLSVVVRGTT